LNLNFGNIPVLLAERQINRNDIEVFLNPSTGVFKIQSDSKIVSIQIIDLHGKLVKSELNSIDSIIDLTNQSSGIYFVRILNEQGEWVSKKLIKY